ncbi:MAG TPA: CHASE3 domain-containing protein [Terriglobales bacterium]|jgi:CHASE3 domain sensor protein|nr:CHASE3 domain-containing protein [Terriglobales bacterium]
MIRKAALQVGVVALFALILWNGYVVVSNVGHMRRIAGLTVQSSMIQAKVSAVVRDLTDMETGQRGYLVTGNSSYLQPYTEAKERIVADFANLRAELEYRGERERSLEAEAEAMANSNQSEIAQSISLRKQGYRHRAFRLVASTDTMAYMDKARERLSSLSAEENSRLAEIETQRSAGLGKILKETIVVDLALLALVASLFALVRYHGRVLEQEAAQSARRLAAHDFQLARLMSALSNEASSKTFAIGANAHLVLQEYGGFLPRHAHQCVEEIEEASTALEQLRQDLVANSGSSERENGLCEAVA